ncbi:hypothetical protein TNIN_58241 [Trichonephila inaurata madagascariensis]|uniref:Uncharacterized protein n=1 Tax=Trichonephila inaurata madagascariensis TaxID=2747483 RepID=A0A8X6YX18_9ARAC|nr:hypothetical protein TNIN_58241 [Trichonephila inaurata madagascariensis]
MNLALANTPFEEKIEMRAKTVDNKSVLNYEDNEIDTTKEDEIISNVSSVHISEHTNAFSSEMDNTRSLRKFSNFTQRSSNITE